MDLLNRNDIQALATSRAEGIHLSLFIPTHRVGPEMQGDQVRWKNLVNGVEAMLLEEMRRPDVEALLEPARELLNNSPAWQRMGDGMAMFLRPGWHQTYRIPASLPILATVGDHFVTGPLMRLLSGDEHFFLLAISQSKVRLMDGSRHTVEQVELGDVPTAVADVLEPPDPESGALVRPMSGNRGGLAVFHGHGAAAEDARKDDLLFFLRQVSSGLDEILRGQSAPLVLVGLEQNVVAYREVDNYGNTLAEAVHHNPDDLSVQQLHDLAWPIVEARLRSERDDVIARARQLDGTGRVSSDLTFIREAAQQGRVETLFMRADPWCWEEATGDTGADVVRLGGDDRYVVCEHVDQSAADTLANGGFVYATSQAVVPDSPVMAILRY
ncbi:hypothetical protein GCM10028820_06380 [Tessaracoccus terricola]